MKAVLANRYGGPDALEIGEIAKPEPKANEVLVRTYASAVTQADVMMRKGTPRFARVFVGLTKPNARVPGTAFSGKIEAVGSDVTRFKVGDDVFGETAMKFSAHAEFVTVPEDGVIETVPLNMSYDEAAPVVDGALTVHNFLTNLATIRPGDKVLINGASGGLGTAAVQFAKYFGAEVTGVASVRNEDLVRQQAADHFIDYTKQDFTKGSERYDVIFDTVGKVSFGKAKRVLKTNGMFLSPVLGLGLLLNVLWTSRFGTKRAKFSATGMLPHDKLRAALSEVKSLIEEGAVWTVIDRRYPLDEIQDAHAYVEAGHKRGTVVIEIAHADTVMLAAE